MVTLVEAGLIRQQLRPCRTKRSARVCLKLNTVPPTGFIGRPAEAKPESRGCK